MTHEFSTHDTNRRLFWIAATVLTAAVSSVACGGSAQATMPLAPSLIPSSAMSVETTDGIDGWGTLGQGKDKDRDKDKGKGGDRDADDGSDAQAAVKIKGVIATVTGACPAVTFVISQRSVVTNALTTYEHGACAQLAPRAPVDVRAVRQADGTLLAKGVEFEDADDDDPKDRIEVKGTVASVQGTCPALRVVVGRRTVVTNAATVFRTGTCAQVQPGAGVHFRGTLQPDETVLANRADVRIREKEDEEDEDSDRNPHHGEGPLEGTVSSFRGVCPTVTFNLKGMTVVTDSTTAYTGGTCATLRPNVKVVVTGTPAAARRTFKAATITITRTH